MDTLGDEDCDIDEVGSDEAENVNDLDLDKLLEIEYEAFPDTVIEGSIVSVADRDCVAEDVGSVETEAVTD